MATSNLGTSHHVKILLKTDAQNFMPSLTQQQPTQEIVLHNMTSMIDAAKAALQQWQINANDVQTLWVRQYSEQPIPVNFNANHQISGFSAQPRLTDTLCIHGNNIPNFLAA